MKVKSKKGFQKRKVKGGVLFSQLVWGVFGGFDGQKKKKTLKKRGKTVGCRNGFPGQWRTVSTLWTLPRRAAQKVRGICAQPERKAKFKGREGTIYTKGGGTGSA